MTILSSLTPGTPVFVEVCSVVRNVPGRIFTGIVIDQQERDETVRVETAAAKTVHAAWASMSFRWSTGLGYCTPLVRIVVPQDEAETALLNARVESGGEVRRQGMAARHVPTGAQKSFWWS